MNSSFSMRDKRWDQNYVHPCLVKATLEQWLFPKPWETCGIKVNVLCNCSALIIVSFVYIKAGISYETIFRRVSIHAEGAEFDQTQHQFVGEYT